MLWNLFAFIGVACVVIAIIVIVLASLAFAVLLPQAEDMTEDEVEALLAREGHPERLP